jgi:hypothetical protein
VASVLWVGRAERVTWAAIGSAATATNLVGASSRGADGHGPRIYEPGAPALEAPRQRPGSHEELDEVSELASPEGKEATE